MTNHRVEVSSPKGQWKSVEEEYFGHNWKDIIDKATKDLESISLDVSDYEAVEMLKEKGHSQEMVDYMRDIQGIGVAWWKFMVLGQKPHTVFVTRNGFSKCVELNHFRKIQRNGKIAIDIRDGDKLVNSHLAGKVMIDGIMANERIEELQSHVEKGFISIDEAEEIQRFVHDNADFVFILTRNGIAVKFPVDHLVSRGRNSRGVRGIRLKNDDKVVSFHIVTNEDDILMVTQNGIGKKVRVGDFRDMKRGAVGVRALSVDEKSGPLVEALRIQSDTQSAMFLTTPSGQMIRIPVGSIPIYKRQARGVSLMNLKEGDTVVNGLVVEDDR